MTTSKTTKGDEEYGRVFSVIRKSKGYSQREVEDTTISFASISRFERGETMIGAGSFMKILANIGTTLSEFENIFQKLSANQDTLPLQSIWTLAKAADRHSYSMVEELHEKILREIAEEPNLKKYQFDRILVEATISRLDPSRGVNPKDIKFLVNYLTRVKRWGRYEILLLSWTTFLYDTDTLTRLFDHMFAVDEQNLLPFNDRKRIIDTGLNVIDTFLARKQLEAAKHAFLVLENYDISDHLLFEKLELKYNKSRFNFLSKIDPEQAIEEMWYYYDVLKYTESFELANVVRKEIKELLLDKPEA